MPGYTSEEVQASIDQFLLGTVSTPRTNLGSRDVLSARDDIYALLTTTLLLKPDSYFYVIWLAKNRLEALRRQQASALSFLLDSSTIAALSRRGKPVTSTVELTNAQAALLNLNAGLNSGQGVQTRELGPEVTRFRNNIERFIRGQLQPNVVEGGVPTETAGETRDRISSTWALVKSRHEEMLTLCAAIKEAISNLSSVRLPEKAVREVIARLRTRLDELTASLPTDRTLSTHREAMLELLTMRTLLARVSSFRVPQRLLAPLSGDGTLATATEGTVPASLTGTISGPYNVPPGSTLDFESGSPIVVSSVTISASSNAETQSREFVSLPITMPASAALQLRVDGVLYANDASFGGASYASAALFVAALQAYLTTNAVPATTFVDGLRAVIRSNSADDVSSIEVLATSVAQQNFITTAGFPRYSVCTPVEAVTLVGNAAPHPGVRLSELRTEYLTTEGTANAFGVLDLSKVSGTISVWGGTTLTSTVNLENIGVRAGDYINAGGEVRQIIGVLGAVITVDADLPVLGSVSYKIGADLRSIPVGTRVLVGSVAKPLNSGPYRVAASDIGELTVDRTFFAAGDPVTVTVLSSFLVAAAPGAAPADGIAVWPASAGATAVGYTASATQTKASVTQLGISNPIDLMARGVSVGDKITVASTPSDSSLLTSVSLAALGVEGLDYFSGSVEYTIESSRYLAWLDLVSIIDDFLLSIDFAAADFAITRILTGAAPLALLGAGGAVAAFSTQITTLAGIQNYVVPFERSVDNILRMLSEQGMDRAVDLFTALRVVEFFSMHADGVSYPTHLIRTAADVTRQVAPVSRFSKSLINSPQVRLRSRRLLGG